MLLVVASVLLGTVRRSPRYKLRIAKTSQAIVSGKGGWHMSFQQAIVQPIHRADACKSSFGRGQGTTKRSYSTNVTSLRLAWSQYDLSIMSI